MQTPAHTRLTSPGRILLAAMSVMLLSACAKPKAPEQLVFADPDNPIATLFYLAEAQGYFKDENLTVTFKKFTSGRESLNSVLAGESDVAVASEYPFADAILQGKALRILCTVQRTNYSSAVVARRDRGIETAADLAGKKIGLTPNTNSDYLLSVLLRESGSGDETVTRVPLQPPQIADALEKDQVDAVAAWQPHVANAQARFAKDATVLLRALSYSELSLIGVRAQALVEKREALQRLMAALVRAEDFVHTQSEEARRIVIEHFDNQPDDSLRQDWPQRKFQVRLDNLLLTALENEGAWMAKRVKTATALPDYRATFAPEFLEAVRPQSVTVAKAGGS